jgi:rubredoxin---NAD+ reductase
MSDTLDASDTRHHATLIIGAGMAGWGLAKALRAASPQADIAIVSADDAPVYSKPMLSSALALGKSAVALLQSTGTALAAQLDVALYARTRVTSIDPKHRCVVTEQGVFTYDDLVLALGAQPIRLPMTGGEHTLSVNHLDDYAVFRSHVPTGGSVALMGGGLIGSEFANDLAASGHRVHVIDPAAWLMSSLISPEQGAGLQAALQGLGVQFYLQDVVVSVTDTGAQKQLRLRSGQSITVDAVLSAVGLHANIELAEKAGLSVARGILVDAYGRTSHPHIYALGDCAAYEGQGLNGAAKTMPYVWPLLAASKAIAASLAGTPTPIAFKALPVRVKTPVFPLSVQG